MNSNEVFIHINQSMYNHNKAQQSKNRVHISWDILYLVIHIVGLAQDAKMTLNGIGKISQYYTTMKRQSCG